ncbi:cupin domain-containing protein [Allomuricauda taeanensis]|uniref:cupin domain-containing protein n=1 Tax=Flagellimonas taeanensis TaxID=1005926 RepID=UPI002E7B8DE9|nr:cupin domain-containing protein [Allomuricauda taeanensis]MEE1963901.1 cupin domain-containing protein [Allomuricauda taeanensis]
MIISKQNSTHYQWGNHCDAWTLLQSENVIIKEEKMPPNTEEQFHYHNETAQFFYILEGAATFLLNKKEIVVKQNEGIKIEEKLPHKIGNKNTGVLHFLVISFPGNPTDRVNL